jgi:antitoxin Phd
MDHWKVQDAQARFSEFLQVTLKQGPQVVTKDGIETAVLLSIEEWRRLQREARPSHKQLLLAPQPRFEGLAPERRPFHRRAALRFK